MTDDFSELSNNELHQLWTAKIKEAVRTWKARLYDEAKKLYDEAKRLSIALRARGFVVGGVGRDNIVYVTRSLKMALENPDSETAAYLTREITDILHWSSPKTADRHTLRNFNVFNVTDDGELVISEPPTTPKQPIIPDRVFTRNADFRNKRVTKLETEKEEVAKFV